MIIELFAKKRKIRFPEVFEIVKIIFLNLLRSKYGIESVMVHPGSVQNALEQIIQIYPNVNEKDFKEAVLFVNQTRVDFVHWLRKELHDGDEVILTHFVGGG
jgi:molybdopterin converting factor small subunit